MLYLRLSGLGDLQVTVPTEVTGVRTGSRNATNGRVRWARWQQGLRGAVQGVDFADAGLSLGTVCWLFAVQCKEDTSSHGLISQFSKIIFMFLFAATLHQAAWAQDVISADLAWHGAGLLRSKSPCCMQHVFPLESMLDGIQTNHQPTKPSNLSCTKVPMKAWVVTMALRVMVLVGIRGSAVVIFSKK